jgi:aminoglycoside 6'-N-acetyltransferase
MLHEGAPIGYIQYYLLDDGAAGIDLFIGEEQLLNRGVGTAAMRDFMALIAAHHDPPYFVIDPSPENRRAIRCYEKVGFRYYATETNDEGEPAYMMRLERRANT